MSSPVQMSQFPSLSTQVGLQNLTFDTPQPLPTKVKANRRGVQHVWSSQGGIILENSWATITKDYEKCTDQSEDIY